jgi:uncharacterized membrane protein
MNDGIVRKVAITRNILLLFYLGLLAIYTLETVLEAYPTVKVQVFILLVKLVPLVVFSPGLLRGNYKTCLWLCFVLLLYFTVNITRLFEPNPGVLDFAETVFLVMLFISAMMYARWRQQLGSPD